MKYEIKNRYTGNVQFTAEIDATDQTPKSIKVGLSVKWAIKNGANLSGAYLIDGGQDKRGYRFVGWKRGNDLMISAGCRNRTVSEARKH